MDKDRIIVILQKHDPELQAAGLVHLRVFGSVARVKLPPNLTSILWPISINRNASRC